MPLRFSSALFILCLLAFLPCSARAGAPPRTLRFSGYEWQVRETAFRGAQGVSGPGPNVWDARNVWVDADGNLHLKISCVPGKSGDEWHCAEITSIKKFGYGRYEFQTTSPIDDFDPNVVLGLFDYPAPGEGADGTNEIDIEFARWGRPASPNANFTVYPAEGKGSDNSTSFEYRNPDPRAVARHTFTRAESHIVLSTTVKTGTANENLLGRWQFAPGDKRLLPQKPLPVHLNLWLFQGHAPTNGREVEVVVKKFIFTPASDK